MGRACPDMEGVFGEDGFMFGCHSGIGRKCRMDVLQKRFTLLLKGRTGITQGWIAANLGLAVCYGPIV